MNAFLEGKSKVKPDEFSYVETFNVLVSVIWLLHCRTNAPQILQTLREFMNRRDFLVKNVKNSARSSVERSKPTALFDSLIWSSLINVLAKSRSMLILRCETKKNVRFRSWKREIRFTSLFVVFNWWSLTFPIEKSFQIGDGCRKMKRNW